MNTAIDTSSPSELHRTSIAQRVTWFQGGVRADSLLGPAFDRLPSEMAHDGS